ncbi:hypothetical protein [Nonlabens xiamenensis]|uniref:hypothetical protein n=1 Tax=Nonlabens xiamenensis TaxID=2341043 RepID=UPI000F605607|nr:hypothetical protein [Nonlabens xiamenensis]
MKNFEYNNRLVQDLAKAGYFSPTLNGKIKRGAYELRESELTVKALVAGKSGPIELLKSGNRVKGLNDFDSGNRLAQGRGFLVNRIELSTGLAADGAVTAEAAVFGAISDDAINESILTIQTDRNVITERSVRTITKGISSDANKISMPGIDLNKVIALKDEAEQSAVVETPNGLSVQSGAGKNAALAMVLSGFEVIGL